MSCLYYVRLEISLYRAASKGGLEKIKRLKKVVGVMFEGVIEVCRKLLVVHQESGLDPFTLRLLCCFNNGTVQLLILSLEKWGRFAHTRYANYPDIAEITSNKFVHCRDMFLTIRPNLHQGLQFWIAKDATRKFIQLSLCKAVIPPVGILDVLTSYLSNFPSLHRNNKHCKPVTSTLTSKSLITTMAYGSNG
jgi:hypothetical protein